jgi:hypothetical protein
MTDWPVEAGSIRTAPEPIECVGVGDDDESANTVRQKFSRVLRRRAVLAKSRQRLWG